MVVIDLSAKRIAAVNERDLSELPAYEPGLDAVAGRCLGPNIHVSNGVEAAIAVDEMVFLSMNTPPSPRD